MDLRVRSWLLPPSYVSLTVRLDPAAVSASPEDAIFSQSDISKLTFARISLDNSTCGAIILQNSKGKGEGKDKGSSIKITYLI